MADPLADYIKPGFPKESANASGYSTVIEYVGPKDILYGQVSGLGLTWGDYKGLVEDVQGDPYPGQSGYVTLVVRMLQRFGDSEFPSDQPGTEQETIYEIEWVNVPKKLIDHPVFQEGGLHPLTDLDRLQLEKWEEMWDTDAKTAFQFYPFDISDYEVGGALDNLSVQAEIYARGRLKGIETFNAKTPVLRKSTLYKNGVPPEGGNVGERDNPVGFPNKPAGYEWIKEADRSINTGKQNEWRRDQEWIGANEVLVDSKNIYWETS